MVYSLCMMADFQNGLIFRILCGFWSGVLHRTTVSDLVDKGRKQRGLNIGTEVLVNGEPILLIGTFMYTGNQPCLL